MTDSQLLYRPIDVDAVPATGQAVHIEAEPDERTAIAEAFRVDEVRMLQADFELRREEGRNRALSLEGRVKAEIVQTCVVSLEPIVQAIDESVAVRFAAREPEKPRHGAEVRVDPEVEPPEALVGGTLDVGAVALEHFALVIDPYPRAPGAELPPEAKASEADKPDSPFAALASLKREADR